MAAARQASPGPSMVPWVLALGVIGSGVATWFGYPGAVLLLLSVTVSAFVAPPAVLTGKRDASGFPTAISPGEQQAMNRFRMWSELKWRSIIPSSDWLPGWPLRLWWIDSVALGVAVAGIPTPALGDWARIADGAAVFVLINVVNGALRRWTAPDDPCPGPTVAAVATLVRDETGKAIALGVGALIAGIALFLGSLVAVDKFGVAFYLDPLTPWELALAIAASGIVAVITLGVRGAALQKWRTMVTTRAAWAPRWQITKLDPAPRLVDHVQVGSAQVDTFDANPAVGAIGIYPLVSKITASIGSGTRIAVLESPNLDSQGQPVVGSKHPLRFRVVTYPSDDLPDINDPAVNPGEAELLIACSAAWSADASGAGRWVLVGIEPMHSPDSPTAAWVAQFATPDGPDFSWMRNNAIGDLGGATNSEVLIDHRRQEVFYGALTDERTVFLNPTDGKSMKELELTDTWDQRWNNILKMGAVHPRPEHAVYAEAKLGNQQTLYRQPFVVQQGMDPLEFYKLEPKISTTLTAAPFVSVSGFTAGGERAGERHAQAFCVTWSDKPVPANPDKLAPTEGQGPKWVLAGRINEAFDVARLARPEVFDVRPLTDKRSRAHIWEMKLRLYGGVTLADVRAKAQTIRQAIGSEWLRVAQAPDGVIIIAGADPKDQRRVTFASPVAKNRDLVTRLEWEQAFSDAKLQNSAGVLPKLVSTATLPSNEQVQVLDFQLPTGTDRPSVKAAVTKLQTATGNAFVEVRPSGLGADHVQLLVSREHPLPSSVGVDWEFVDLHPELLPFATGVEGEPVSMNPRADPHILVAGASGGGKSVSLQVLLYPAAVHGAELYVIDPTKGGADFQFVQPYARAFAASVEEAAAVMRAVYAEVVRRKNMNAAHGVGGYRDLPEEIRPRHIYVVMDEFTSLMQPDPVSKIASDDPEVEFEREQGMHLNRQKAYIGTMAGKIAREARSAGVTLVLATQKLSAKMLDDIPGAGDLKTNLARMLMGNATFGEKQSALKSPTEAPELGDVVPKGRGLWESTEANARVIQVWFEASQATFAAKLAERRAPLTEDEKLDLEPYMQRPATPGGDDAPHPQRPTAQFATEPEIVELDEIEFSLDDLLDGDESAEEEGYVEELNTDWPSDDDHTSADEQHTRVVLLGRGAHPAAWDGDLVVELPAAQTDEDDELYGWWKIDAVLAALDAHPDVTDIVWVDADLADEDEIGVEHADLVRDVFEDGAISVRLIIPGDQTMESPLPPVEIDQPTPPAAPAPPIAPVVPAPAVPTARSEFDEPTPAASQRSMFDDEF